MKFMKWLLVSVLGLTLSVASIAQERGTKEEAKAMTLAAVEHIKKVGQERAYNDFTNDKANWTKKDLYVMVYNDKAITQAHGANPKLIGKDMTNVRDAAGVQVVVSLIAVAAKGGGWLDYDWPDPITKKIAPKSTYAVRQPNGEGFVGVGIYR